MKRFALLLALLPAVAFAQQMTHMEKLMAQAMAKSAQPGSGDFPASCDSPMANDQMMQAMQQVVGNPMGDVLEQIVVTRQVGETTDTSYSCMIGAVWRDHVIQHGLLSFIKSPNGVIVNWHPFGY